MDLINLSSEYDQKLYGWLPRDLIAEKVVFFPDACPGKAPLPTGTATLLRRDDWMRFAISDCGCGMRLMRSTMTTSDLTPQRWERVADRLCSNKGSLGDLGGGNHFLDALEPHSRKQMYFLIHTGSRSESGLVNALVDQPAKFDREFSRIVGWARDNRAAVQEALEAEFGDLELVLDLPHNTYEVLPDGGVIIRKGAVRVEPGDLNVIPSHLAGDVALVRATNAVRGTLLSLSHGTGRKMARSASKGLADAYDFESLRRCVLMPNRISDSSLRTEGPYAYRELGDCLSLLEGYVELVEQFSIVGYIGHL